MADDPDVSELMARLRDGDQQAAADVFHRFSTRLVALAGSRLGVGLQRKVDAEDIVQSAFRSFYRRQGADRLRGMTDTIDAPRKNRRAVRRQP